MDGTHDFRIADDVVVDIEIVEVNAARAVVPLVVRPSGYIDSRG